MTSTPSGRPPPDDGQQAIHAAYDGLEEELPDRISRLLCWLRHPNSR